MPLLSPRGSDDQGILTMLWPRHTTVTSMPVVQQKSPVLAALLSFLLVGMGQIYLGQVEKGLCMLATVLLLIITVVLGPLGVAILIFNVLDAFVLAVKIRKGEQVGKWQFFFSRSSQEV